MTPQIAAASERFREITHIIQNPETGALGLGFGGSFSPRESAAAFPLWAVLPAMYPEWLGDESFRLAHGLRFPYLSGAMANGIATARLVAAMARSGMMGFFGSAGLSLERVEAAIQEIRRELKGQDLPFGVNLIHSIDDPAFEEATVDLFLKTGVRRADASAFMKLSPAAVRYSATGLRPGPGGTVLRRNFLFAKISRAEVAGPFMSPAPPQLLASLFHEGKLSEQEFKLASRVSVASDIIVEADSGGHTDNRPLSAIFRSIAELRDQLGRLHSYAEPVRVGAAGGLGTPAAVAAAFALGASFVLTGSINQCAVESGTSDLARALLAEAAVTDVAMAPAADMFEMGVKVQVLKKGTMWPLRAQKLFELYRAHDSYEAIAPEEREKVERDILRDSFENIWQSTRDFFEGRDPRQVERAERDPKHRMALVFRWYLGMGSRWAIQGEASRKGDYQLWCGPAQGAFNEWARGSFLESPANRGVVQIALNLMEGATAVTRAQQFRSFGLEPAGSAFDFRPRKLEVTS
ncbi:MAG TPA: PfaD family polyunsaturated fatty acid/polyketide biosynthesis protein [bacterium]|nr:PfaD family polyunsaturated fatty acid/polyketide biosynthesis protein [bacterium]